jgi:PKD repeat protein
MDDPAHGGDMLPNTSNPWVRIGAVVFTTTLIALMPACGGGGGGGGGTTGATNGAPTATFTFSPGSPVLMGATVVQFSANGADPNGDPITFTWNFGDGSTGSGQNVAHVFQTAGSLSVVLTAADSRGAQTTTQNPIVVRSLTGRWLDADPRFQVDFTHNSGSAFTGAVNVSGFGKVSDITNGTVSDPRTVSFHRDSFVAGFATVDYQGTVDAALNKMHVVAVQNSATSFDLTRQ